MDCDPAHLRFVYVHLDQLSNVDRVLRAYLRSIQHALAALALHYLDILLEMIPLQVYLCDLQLKIAAQRMVNIHALLFAFARSK